MWIPDWLAKLIGKEIRNKLNLQEGQMANAWYKNTTVWTDIVTIVVTVYGMIGSKLGPDLGVHIPAIPGVILTILGAIGIYHQSSQS